MHACHSGTEPRRWSASLARCAIALLILQCPAFAEGTSTGNQGSEPPNLRARFKLENAFVEQLPADLDFGGFQVALQESAFGTYVFYDRLTDDNKHKIYDGYQQDRNISAIGVKTLELLRSQ